ncbi:hypothetical protein [Kitasatospora sp. MBT66]|uniref:hypothetical protein n=1 Tax=Kitasatospora sp. MBT66 TaxID=1444769 RepID=UPI00068EEF34|nr:hypothetical protein [Kitasatospora sp. MBT66]
MGVTCEVTCFGVRRYRLDAPVAMLPLPLCAPLYRPPSHTETRERLGVPPDARCVLPTSGGWSLGPLARTAAELADAGAHVVTLGGSNTARNASCAWPRYRPRLHAFGWTDPVPELISAADLVVTSSGDTCSEARALGRRLLILDVVQGHGRDNLQHELELGHADVGLRPPRRSGPRRPHPPRTAPLTGRHPGRLAHRLRSGPDPGRPGLTPAPAPRRGQMSPLSLA